MNLGAEEALVESNANSGVRAIYRQMMDGQLLPTFGAQAAFEQR